MLTQRAIELIAEGKIEQAIKDGQFNKLSGFGRPFEFDSLGNDPNWWIKQKIRTEQIAELQMPEPTEHE